MEKTLSLKRATFVIFLSLFFITGPIALTVLYYQSERARLLKDKTFVITELKTHTIKRDSLPDDYFAEQLNLSKDKPTNLAAFNLAEAEARLRGSPVIEWVRLKREGHTLLIDYSMPNPLCHLIDYENTLMNGEGTIFPREPYFLEKRLPEVYLGLKPYGEDVRWGSVIQDEEKRELAFTLLKLISDQLLGETTRLVRIDVSKSFAKSLGQREIVVTLEERFPNGVKTVYLRLNNDVAEGLQYYTKLRDYLAVKALEKMSVVDLRLKGMGFITHLQTPNHS